MKTLSWLISACLAKSLNTTYWTITTLVSNLTFSLESTKLSILQHTINGYNQLELNQGMNVFYEFEGVKELGVQVGTLDQNMTEILINLDNLLFIKQSFSTNSTQVTINQPTLVSPFIINKIKNPKANQVGLSVGGLVIAVALLAYLLVLGDEELDNRGGFGLQGVYVEEDEEEKEEMLPPYELEYKILM